MKAFKFLEYVLISTIVIRSKYNNNKKSKYIFTKQNLFEGQKLEIIGQRLGQKSGQVKDWIKKVRLKVGSVDWVRSWVKRLG